MPDWIPSDWIYSEYERLKRENQQLREALCRQHQHGPVPVAASSPTAPAPDAIEATAIRQIVGEVTLQPVATTISGSDGADGF